MKKQTNITILNTLMISMLILNLFIFTSRMSFLPWFIEDGWGYAGLLLTSVVFLISFFISWQLHKNGELTTLQKFIPLIAAIFSLVIMLMHSSDFKTIFAIMFNSIILIIYIWKRPSHT
ncbi:hypothetical protein [Bacillus paramycoides]|uniref:hypothetical protein n=1 Tax=Bacillus paramycoides TaxID=2026194 RepID=UPI002E217AD7|nr:hypothetical protein [Bacillus paramycoides]